MEVQIIGGFTVLWLLLGTFTIITSANYLLVGIKGFKQARVWLCYATFSVFAWGTYTGAIFLYYYLEEKNSLLLGMGVSGLFAPLIVWYMILRLVREIKEISEQTGIVYRRDIP